MDERFQRKVAVGVVTKLLANVPLQLAKLLLTFLCLRFLRPQDYGAASLALAIYGFSDMLTNPGIRTYLIRNQSCSDATIDAIWSFSSVRGVALTALFFAAAPLLSALFHGDETLTRMLRMLSASFLFIGVRNLHTIRYQQQLRFGKGMIAETGGEMVGTLLAIGALIYTREAWVLIGGVVCSNACIAALSFWVAPVRPRVAWNTEELRQMWRFTRYLLANAVIIYALTNLDDLFVARVLGTVALGIYSMSYNMVNWSVLFITRPLGDLLLPTLAKVHQDRAAFTRASKVAIGSFSAVSWGIIATLWVHTDDLFLTFASPVWREQAAPIFRALLPFVLVRGVNQAIGAMVLAAGRPRTQTVVAGVQLALMVPVAYAGLLLAGFLGLTVAVTALNAASLVAMVWLIPTFIDTARRHVWLLIFAPAPPALLAAFGAGWLSAWIDVAAVRFVAGIVCSLSAYIALWELACRSKRLGALGAQPISALWQRIGRGRPAQIPS